MTQATGERPVGYRAPSWNFSPNTLDIIRDLGFLYDSSLMVDDRPYELNAAGESTGPTTIETPEPSDESEPGGLQPEPVTSIQEPNPQIVELPPKNRWWEFWKRS